MMWRVALPGVLAVASFVGVASAERIELRCRQELSEVYSMGRTGMLSMTYPDDVDVVISLDTETDRAALDQNVGMFDVGDDQVLIMMVSDQLKEVWDIDRATGRGLVIAYLIEERRTVFIRREAVCELPEAMSLSSVAP